MNMVQNRDFEAPTDSQLTDHKILDAERLVVDYVYQSGELPKEVVGKIKSDDVKSRGEALNHMFGDVLGGIESLKVVA